MRTVVDKEVEVSESRTTKDPEEFLPLSPATTHIMLALADGEKHGYAIMREVERLTNDEVSMGPGTLYGSIKRMLGAGLIAETEERPDPDMDDERRRYYQLSGLGERVLSAETERLATLVRAADSKKVRRLRPSHGEA
ncbi:MAG: PadR family transcriptional regulator [Acidimicrobiia bacterium]|nr:PadR family transcriptional regulator [Acidimicrobiia bacterium]